MPVFMGDFPRVGLRPVIAPSQRSYERRGAAAKVGGDIELRNAFVLARSDHHLRAGFLSSVRKRSRRISDVGMDQINYDTLVV